MLSVPSRVPSPRVPEPLAFNSIERLSRALLAALAPATGVRATGTVTVTALPGDVTGSVELPANTYLRPIVGGQLLEALFKTTADWTVAAGATEGGVGITSNLGGGRHNLPAGTVLRFDPEVDGLEPTATLDADMTDGADAGALIRSLAFFEDLDSSNPEKDIFAALLTTPAVMLVWTMSEPAEGALGGLRQGANRGARSVKFWRENFVLYVVSARLASDTARRQDGLVIAQAVTRLLTDRMRNDDGEQLSSVGGGVEVIGRARYRRDARRYIYALRLRANQTLEPVLDGRAFQLWLAARYTGALPGRAAPEPTEPLVIVDALDNWALGGHLVLPRLELGGGFRPLVTLTASIALPIIGVTGSTESPVRLEAAAFALPSLALAGGVTPVVALAAAALALPAVTLAGGVRPAVTLATGALSLPSLALSGSVRPALAIAGALALPSLRLSGSVRPVARVAGTLGLPSLALAGGVRPAASLSGSPVLPHLTLTGAVRPVVSLAGSATLPRLTLAGGVRPLPHVAGSLTLPSLTLAGGVRPLPRVAGALTLPQLTLAGSVRPLPHVAGALTLPSLALSGSVRPLPRVAGSLTLPSLGLAGGTRPLPHVGGSLTLPSLALAGTIRPTPTVGGSLLLPSLKLAGSITHYPVAVTGGAVTAWLRVASATVTGSGVSSLPDMLSSNTAVQTDDVRRPPRVAAANGLLVVQGVDDWLIWPANAGNNQLVTWGFGAHVKIDSLGTGFMTLLRSGATTTNDPAATDSARIGIFTPGQVNLQVINNASATLGRSAFSSTNKLNATGYVFMTVEFNGALTGDANKVVMTFDGVVDSGMVFTNGPGTPGAMPAALQGQPAGTNIALFNRRADILQNQTIAKVGPNIYQFGLAMAGVTQGLLTPAARLALSNYEKPT